MSDTRHLTLPTTPLEHPASDYAFLRQEGIRHLERLAGTIWTDFNAHDPGITILEQLCYAITDLSYRIDYELPDLLAESGDGDAHRSLPGPAAILTSHPVTLNDLRKAVIDVEGVRNAWIEKIADPTIPLHYHEGSRELRFEADGHSTEPVTLKGVYRVLIEKSELFDATTVARDVARRLHANRGLCEDFEIQVLASQSIEVQARIEIGPVDDPEQVMLAIYHRIAAYLSPAIPFLTLEEMLATGKRIDEIFDGPRLDHGFIDTAALLASKRRTTIYTSDLIHEIMNVPGVRAVRHIAVGNAPTGAPQDWSLDLEANHVPRLDLDHPRITLERENLTVSLDMNRVITAYTKTLQHSSGMHDLEPAERDLLPSRGRRRDVATYYSIQQQFPTVYGVSEAGLPASAPARRKGRAKQLKAYLMFFDQLLANYFAQLAHVGELFSFYQDGDGDRRGDGLRTYYASMLDDPGLGLDAIRVRDAEAHRAWLDDRVEAAHHELRGRSEARSARGQRKNRFLNHLLARFAEHFTDYSLILFDAMPDSEETPEAKLARDKQAFLQRYPRISSARGTGHNYLEPHGDGNVSGLEERVRLRLGLVTADGEDFYLIEHLLLRPLPEDDGQRGRDRFSRVPLLADSTHRDPYSLQLSFVFPSSPRRLQAVSHDGDGDGDRRESSPFRRFIAQTVREETPAHLTPYIHWLDAEQWSVFERAYTDWQEQHRRYWADRLGL